MHTFAYWTQTRFNFELNVHSVVSRESLPFLLSRLILLNVLYEYNVRVYWTIGLLNLKMTQIGHLVFSSCNVHMLSENKSLIF